MSTRSPQPRTLMTQMYPANKGNNQNKKPAKTPTSDRIIKTKYNDSQQGKLTPLA